MLAASWKSTLLEACRGGGSVGVGVGAVALLSLLSGWRRRCLSARRQCHVARRAASASALEADGVVVGNFVEGIVAADLERGTYGTRVCTRFPPEPNGHLHIGHVKSICLNFGIARKFAGTCNLRFDDTNPASEKQEYIDSIKDDVRWLGFEWDGPARYASDYFVDLHEWAKVLIERGQAYVDELSAEEIGNYRGSLTSPGKDSPFRSRPIAENIQLFADMQSGVIAPGGAVLRAKIDMAHQNVIMRDPIMYRILKDIPHPRTGSTWIIYPSYDWAHGLSDAYENITHSVCTLEFNKHNELYDWFNERVKELGTLKCDVLPHQHEFARLEMTHIVVSKRKLKRLVDGGYVDGWDDPRMPTISGMRRRGYPAVALRKMCELIGVTKVATSVIQYSLLESCVRDVLEEESKVKLLCVLKPLRVVVTNYLEDGEEVLEGQAVEGMPARPLPFGRELVIDSDDFMAEPIDGFKRLAPGRTAKLRYAYTITCDEIVRSEDGQVCELRCTYDAESLGMRPPTGAAIIHWAHATKSVPVRARLYNQLFSDERPEEREDFLEALNPHSVEVCDARCEPVVEELGGEMTAWRAQFERCGYFIVDEAESKASRAQGGPLVFNRALALTEAWKPKGPARPAAGERKAKSKKEGNK